MLKFFANAVTNTIFTMQVSDVDVDKLLVHKKVTWLNSPETMKASSLRWSPAPLRKLKNETTVRCFGMYVRLICNVHVILVMFIA